MTETLNTLSQHWYHWQIAMLWQTAALIALIWSIDRLIRRWAWPQLRYALWMLVLVKLLIPPTLTSPASITAHLPAAAIRAATVMERADNSPPAVDLTKALAPTGQSDPAPQRQIAVNGTQASSLRQPEQQTNVSTDADQTIAAAGTERIASANHPADPPVTLSWTSYAMLIWLAGIAVLSTWLLRRLSGLRKGYTACHPGPRAGIQGDADGNPLPEQFSDQLRTAADRLNLKRLPRVVLTDRVAAPAVFGIFRPVLLMPAKTFKHMSIRETEHILLHELAHIKRGDLLIHALYMTLQILYWFNPLLWAIRRTLQNLRELCCDATVARLLREDTVHYRQTLLETARRLVAEPVDPGLGLLGLFENNNWLITRLHWLEKKTWKNRPLRIATIIILVTIMTACVLPMANRPKTKAPSGSDTMGGSNYTATLDNGVTIELIAVSNYPSDGKTWWTPDGSPCPLAIKTEDHSGYPSQDPGYEFVFRKTGDQPFKIESVKGSDVNSGLTILQPADLTGKRVHIKSRYRKTDIKIASPSGQWKTVHTTTPQPKGTTSATVNGKTLVLAAIKEAENAATVSCSDELGYKDATRIIAIDPAGREYTGQILADAGVNNIRQRTIQFILPITTSINKISFQTCPYEYHTFKNVALRPNFKVALPHGLAVELIAVREHPDKQWWTPDGKSLADALDTTKAKYDKSALFDEETERKLEIVYQCSWPDLPPKIQQFHSWKVEIGRHQCRILSYDTLDVSNTSTIVIAVPKALKETTATVSVGLNYGEVDNSKRQWATFKNIALRHRGKTDVEVEIDKGHSAENEIIKAASARDAIIERTLTASKTMIFYTTFFDFKANTIFAFPEKEKFWDVPLWMAEHGIDVICVESENGPTLTGNGKIRNAGGNLCKFVKTDVGMDGSVQDLENAWENGESMETVDHGGWDNLPARFFFKSRDGDNGILEITHIDEHEKSITFKYKLFGADIAPGEWTTRFTHNGHGSMSSSHNGHGTMSSSREKHGIAFSKAYQIGNDIEMTVSDDYFGVDYRLIAIGKNGDIHTTNNRNFNSAAGKVRQSTFTFRNLNLENIKEFQFQTRPDEEATFKNIALNPDSQTDVEIEQSEANGLKAEENSRIRVAGKLLNKCNGKGINDATIHFVGAPDDDAKTYPDGAFAAIAGRGRFHQTYFWLDDKAFHGNQYFGIQMNNHIDEKLAENLQIHIDPENLPKERSLRDEDGDGIFCDGLHCTICDPQYAVNDNGQQAEFQPVNPLMQKVQTVSFKQNMQLAEALQVLAQMYQVNIIPSGKTKMRTAQSVVGVTNLYDVTFEDILKALCGTTHKYVIKDNFVYVYTNEEYEALHPDSKTDVEISIENGQSTKGADVSENNQQAKTGAKVPSLEEPVESLEFKNTPLKEALRMLAQMYKVNIIPSQKIMQDSSPVPITRLYNVTFEEILNAACGSTHAYVKQENLIHVYTIDEFEAIRDTNLQKALGALKEIEGAYTLTLSEFPNGDIGAAKTMLESTLPYLDQLEKAGQMATIETSTFITQYKKVIELINQNENEKAQAFLEMVGEIGRTLENEIQQELEKDTSYRLVKEAAIGGLIAPPAVSPSDEGPIDIAPADFTLRFDEQRGTYSLVVSIQNDTDTTIPKHKIRYYRGDPNDGLDETGRPHTGHHEAGPIQPGQTWNEATYGFTLSDGDYTFTVILDYDNAIAETNETNNRAALQATVRNGEILDSSYSQVPAQDSPTEDSFGPADFKGYFSDNRDGAEALTALWADPDKDIKPAEEILETVRRGLRRYSGRGNILRWIGNLFIWGQNPQHPKAIELMLHASGSPERDIYGDAVYFGLSVAKDKTPEILQSLAAVAMKTDDYTNVTGRILWGCRGQEAELIACLDPYLESDDPAVRQKAQDVKAYFTDNKAFMAKRAEEHAASVQAQYGGQLETFKNQLLNGNSQVRRAVLQRINSAMAVVDESFIDAFAACLHDAAPDVRQTAARMLGNKYIWSSQAENPRVIELLTERLNDPDRQTRYAAVYYGLSTVTPDRDLAAKLLQTILDDREINYYGRVIWGLRRNVKAAEDILQEWMDQADQDLSRAVKAYEIYEDVTGRTVPPELADRFAGRKSDGYEGLAALCFRQEPITKQQLQQQFQTALTESGLVNKVLDFYIIENRETAVGMFTCRTLADRNAIREALADRASLEAVGYLHGKIGPTGSGWIPSLSDFRKQHEHNRLKWPIAPSP